MEGSRKERRFWPVALAVVVAVVCALLAVFLVLNRERAAAQGRAVVVLISVLEAPVATPVVEAATGEPRVEETRIAGNPTSVFVPAGEGPYPAVVFANGTIPEGREFEGVRDLAGGFARAGYLVAVPDLPGLMTDTITPNTVSETVDVVQEVSERPEVWGGRVGLVGVSTGATLALLAAEDPAVAARVSAVAGVAPYTDIRTVLSIATTAHYEKNGETVPYRAEPFLSYVVARSLISALPPGEDRETLLAEMDAVRRYGPDPLGPLRGRPTGDLGPEARRVVALLANTDPARSGALYQDLPPATRAEMDALSPVAGAEKLEAPVELITGPRDKYFPPSESYRLRRVAPDRRVTVTGVLDHSEIRVSLRTLPDLLELNGFALRSLRALDPEPVR